LPFFFFYSRNMTHVAVFSAVGCQMAFI
jgi:hypothetical protein